MMFEQGFEPKEQYNKMVEQARGEGGQGGKGGIVETSYRLFTDGEGYAFKGGFGMVMGGEIEGYDARNFRTGLSCDRELVFPEGVEARMALEEDFERECEEQYAAGGQAGCGGEGGMAVEAKAATGSDLKKKKEPARVGDLISVSDFIL